MQLATALAKKLKESKNQSDDDGAFADAAREVFEFAKNDDVDGFAAALRGAIDIAILDKDRES